MFAYELLSGHTDVNSAVVVDDYPYGSLRTQKKFWVDGPAKKGSHKGEYRLAGMTRDPKRGVWNKPALSTYAALVFLYRDGRDGHVHQFPLHCYLWPDHFAGFVASGLYAQLSPRETEQVDALVRVSRKASPVSWKEFDDAAAEIAAADPHSHAELLNFLGAKGTVLNNTYAKAGAQYLAERHRQYTHPFPAE